MSYSLPWADADLSPFELSNSDKVKIESGHPVPCRLCEAVFRVLTLTMRYCSTCEQGYCQPSHGGWVGRRGVCLQHGPHQSVAAKAEREAPRRGAPVAPAMMAKMKAKVDELRLDEQLQAKWDSFCDNCHEPLNGREEWVRVYGREPDDDDPVKTYYCTKCMTVEPDRRKREPRK